MGTFRNKDTNGDTQRHTEIANPYISVDTEDSSIPAGRTILWFSLI